MNVAKGWFAYGTVAVSPFVAVGGIAVGMISLGGISMGLLTTAGLGIGLFSFSALAIGGVVMGGLAIGWIAMGGAAWGWFAAMGGLAWSGLYAVGRHVSAPHANDMVAKEFFRENSFAQAAQWIADHGWMAQWAIFLPWVLVFIGIRQLQHRKSGPN